MDVAYYEIHLRPQKDNVFPMWIRKCDNKFYTKDNETQLHRYRLLYAYKLSENFCLM
jgi:hypothetical protein